MTSPTRNRVAAAAAVVSLGLVAGPAVAASGTGAYEPFVTDFPRGTPSQTYTPFVTDFGIDEPRPPGGTVEIRGSDRPAQAPAAGLDWTDVTIGAGFGLAFSAALAATALAVRVRRRGSAGAGLRSAAESAS